MLTGKVPIEYPIPFCDLYRYEAQRASATASNERWDSSGKFPRPIVTEITPASTFYRAEEYHQRYLEKHGLASCHIPERQ